MQDSSAPKTNALLIAAAVILSLGILLLGILLKYWWLSLTGLSIGLISVVIAIISFTADKTSGNQSGKCRNVQQNTAGGFQTYAPSAQSMQTADDPFLWQKIVLVIEIITVIVLLLIWFNVI